MSNPFDMNALGAMLSQLGAMMQSGGASSGPVNWDLAQSTAREAIAQAGDPGVDEAARVQTVAALNLAETWLDAVTTFPRAGTDGQAWSRSAWLEHTTPAWKTIVAPIAEHIQSVTSASSSGAITDLSEFELPPALRDAFPDGIPPEAAAMLAPLLNMAQQMGASMFGMQLGQGLAALATQVLGSADVGVPLTFDHRPTLVPANVAAFTDGLGIDADEVRLYLALRECAHQRLFAHVPWLRSRLEGAVDAYARGIHVDTDRLQGLMQDVDPQSLGDPSALAALLGEDAFVPEDTPEQAAALARLETLLALIEGWVDDVVGHAAGDRLPAADRLAETMRRRRAAGGPAERTFASLVGLELRPRALREAAALWTLVRAERGMEGSDDLWSHPDLLPDRDDLDDPAAFLTRSAEQPEDFA
ncbi:MAG: zinc-dependent metalloprotease [Candidatus Nanopelagicales bacterium]